MSAANEPSEAIGTVTHWFGHLSVAAVNLTGPLAVGDRVHVLGHVTDLVQTIHTMEIDHRRVERAVPGDDVAVGFDDHVREHDRLYREG
ncbi:MAG: collagenase [Chloroflexi bacterium]|nr:collagenase [Chloroflexota bacterium]